MRQLAGLCGVLILTGCSPEAPPRAEEAPPPAARSEAVRITHFYAGSKEIAGNQSVGLCYGVENAKRVRLEPPVEQLTPGYNRCFYLTPARTTTYRLVAEGFEGSTASESVTVKVRPAAAAPAPPETYPGLFTMTFASTPEVSPGEAATLCYGAPEAAQVTVDPPVQQLKPAGRFCFEVKPERTTTYRFSAMGKNGAMETATLTVKVR
ncbi:MAG: hypothetical protein IT159_12980 [Bryobacterales bacterium]|nr:hypothetical protein [Bryobacterales bacterium]